VLPVTPWVNQIWRKTPIEVANLRTNFKFLKLYGKIIEALIVILTKNGYLKINILNFADK